MNVLKKLIKTLTNLKVKDFLLLLITISLLKIAFFGVEAIVDDTVYIGGDIDTSITGSVDTNVSGQIETY